MTEVFLNKLRGDYHERSYVAAYFMYILPRICVSTNQRNRCISAISQAIIDGEQTMIEALQRVYWSYPNDWGDEFHKQLEDLKESNPDLHHHFFGGFEEDALPF